jgi:hypothetical protein
MRGPYLLRPLQVDISVPTRVGGVYCLGKTGRTVTYVGRADHDLRDKIKSHWPEYQMFWYQPALSPRDAFLSHCQTFHKHADASMGAGDHPSPPGNISVKCPICGR